MPLTPVEIRQTELKRSANGYDCAEADRLIEELATRYEELWLERINLQEQVESLGSRLARSRRRRNVAVGVLAVAAVVLGAFVVWIRWYDNWPNVTARPAARLPQTPPLQQAGEGEPVGIEQRAEPVSERARADLDRTTRPRRARVVIAATRGDSWLVARVDSESGKLLYEGTLKTGEDLRLVRRRLWLRIGAPSNLDVRLNGKPALGVPRGTANLVLTRKGVHTLSLG